MRVMRVRLSLLGALAISAFPVPTPLCADDLMTVADRLVRQNLMYVYGSDDLHNGGLDCSGFTQTVFREACGIELPDEADKQLTYCREHGEVWDSKSDWLPVTLRPGDLVFYAGPRDIPRTSRISHVMIYCGRGIVVGAQVEGKRLDGQRAGVGYYSFGVHFPCGVLGESGERFIGHLKIFAYGRLSLIPIATPPALIVSRPAPAKPSDASTAAALDAVRKKLHFDPTALNPVFD